MVTGHRLQGCCNPVEAGENVSLSSVPLGHLVMLLSSKKKLYKRKKYMGKSKMYVVVKIDQIYLVSN